MPKATTPSATPKTAPFPAQMMSRALPMQLLRAREAVMQRFRPKLRELGLTDQQGRIMRALAEVALTEIEWIDMMELAGRCCIHPASLSRIVPRLVERGLLRRRPDPQDARRMTVALTAKGRSTFWNVWVESERIYGALAEELGAANLEALHRSLEVLIEGLGGAEATVPASPED